MKKTVCIVFSLLCLLLVTACSQKENVSDEQEKNTAENTETQTGTGQKQQTINGEWLKDYHNIIFGECPPSEDTSNIDALEISAMDASGDWYCFFTDKNLNVIVKYKLTDEEQKRYKSKGNEPIENQGSFYNIGHNLYEFYLVRRHYFDATGNEITNLLNKEEHGAPQMSNYKGKTYLIYPQKVSAFGAEDKYYTIICDANKKVIKELEGEWNAYFDVNPGNYVIGKDAVYDFINDKTISREGNCFLGKGLFIDVTEADQSVTLRDLNHNVLSTIAYDSSKKPETYNYYSAEGEALDAQVVAGYKSDSSMNYDKAFYDFYVADKNNTLQKFSMEEWQKTNNATVTCCMLRQYWSPCFINGLLPVNIYDHNDVYFTYLHPDGTMAFSPIKGQICSPANIRGNDKKSSSDKVNYGEMGRSVISRGYCVIVSRDPSNQNVWNLVSQTGQQYLLPNFNYDADYYDKDVGEYTNCCIVGNTFYYVSSKGGIETVALNK